MTIQSPRSTPPTLTWIKVLASLALAFGIMTVISGSRDLLGPVAAQIGADNVISVVLWFNVIAGGACFIAAIGLWMGINWAMLLSALIAIASAFVAVWFAIVVTLRRPFEMRTVAALTLRLSFWTAVASIAKRTVTPA